MDFLAGPQKSNITRLDCTTNLPVSNTDNKRRDSTLRLLGFHLNVTILFHLGDNST